MDIYGIGRLREQEAHIRTICRNDYRHYSLFADPINGS